MFAIGIIWNSAYNFRSDIKEISKKYGNDLFSFSLDLNERYNDFVKEIYKNENMQDFKITEKIKHMENFKDKKIYVIFFDLNADNVFFHEKKQKFVAKNIEDLKTEIRDNYKNDIQNYYFDIIFHLTDNQGEFISNLRTINKYINTFPKSNTENYDQISKKIDGFLNKKEF